MRVIITSSRDWVGDMARDRVWTILHMILDLSIELEEEKLEVVHGDCPTGGDFYASEYCKQDWFEPGVMVVEEPHPADWGRWGKSAGPTRNQEMAELGADLCVAFIRETADKPVSKGTRDMIARAKKNGIPVKEIHWKDEYATQF